MAENLKLIHPWFIAVWPGMGNVALDAGFYLLAKLGMHVIAEFEAANLFDVDQVEVKKGLIQNVEPPRNRFFLWTDPNQKHDIVIFVGEAQPPIGKYAFCHKLIEYARQLDVERVFTFAAMATQMHPEHRPRVFGAATDRESLEELKRLELELLQDGHIGGLNGVLLGAAAANKMRGICLLGEMPHIFTQLPFPKASKAILEVFTTIAGIELDFTELSERVRIMQQQLVEFLAKVEEKYGPQYPVEDEGYRAEAVEDKPASSADEQRIEALFEQARKDRSKAFELKQELDRLEVFKDYEDRFLDLFKKPSG
jgi:proteasome assembly chaperone (PAC2) family protein